MEKISVHRLPVTSPPIPDGGGRIVTPAGELTQILNGQEFRLLVYMEFAPDATKPRGNHYHRKKTELLYLIAGRLRAVYRDLTTDETAELILEPGDLVTVEPDCAHVYYALEHSQAVEMAATAYDPADTIPYVVEPTESNG